MKILKLSAIVVFALLVSECKTTSPTAPSVAHASVSEVAIALDTIEQQIFRYADSTIGNDHTLLALTANWLASQKNIQSVSLLDSTYLYVTLRSGLTGLYYLDEVDDYGMSLARGGKGGGVILSNSEVLSAHTITNPNVLIFAPVFDEFYTVAEFQKQLSKFSNSGLGLNVTVKRDSECTTGVVDHFGDYGFVIMDTHGAPNGFLIGTLLPDTLARNEDRLQLLIDVNTGNKGYDNLQAGQLMLARGLSLSSSKPVKQQQRPVTGYYFSIVLTSKYVQQLSKLPGTVIFGNMCYSGYSQPVPSALGVTTPIQTAFLSLNPLSYYGYAYSGGTSAAVSNVFAKQMEDSLITELVTNTDSTGHCYLQGNGSEYYDAPGLQRHLSTQNLYLKHFGANDYSYLRCGDSVTDARDGQKYATVCIGPYIWMAQNLNYNASGSLTYNNDPANAKVYGRLYDFQTLMQGADSTSKNPSGVQGVCPKGWHIPSSLEYALMEGLFGGSKAAGGLMKSTSALWNSPNAGATNSTGFTGLPGGYVYAGPPVTFTGLGDQAYFATTTLSKTGNWQIWLLSSSDSYSGSTGLEKTTSVSCRCVKDQ